jgi:hypothetical protein
MSPHAQTSFVNDLVVMAKAYEELPGVREELRTTRDQLDAAVATVQRLELKLIDRASQIDVLNSSIRQLEVSRDDAELRFLEADDRTEKALAFVRTTFGNAGQLLQALEPPKLASAASEAVPEAPQGPFGTSETQSSERTEGAVSVQQDPTASSLDAPSTSELSIAESTDTAKSEGTGNASGPYSNKRYYDHPFYVSLIGWLAGGGTEEDYTWRPNQQMIG